eukprot:jgi/Psemu1/41191/gm1.41191_g
MQRHWPEPTWVPIQVPRQLLAKLGSQREGSGAQKLTILSSSPMQACNNEDDNIQRYIRGSANACEPKPIRNTTTHNHFRRTTLQGTKRTSLSVPPATTPHCIAIRGIYYKHSLLPATSNTPMYCPSGTARQIDCPPTALPTKGAQPPYATRHPISCHWPTKTATWRLTLLPNNTWSQQPQDNTLPTMPITNLICLQTKCMPTGHLTTYSSMSLPNTAAAIDTACNTFFLKTLGSPPNAVICSILQTSPKICFLYINTHGTVQAGTHSLFPWTDPAGTSNLVSANTNSETFNAFVIRITPKNTVATDPASQVGSNPLDHDGSTDTMPQFVLVSLLWPTTFDIPVSYPVVSPLPEGSYNVGFATWLAAIHFLTTKNQASSLHTRHTLFTQLDHNVVSLCNAAVLLMPTTSTPDCHSTCLPFINDSRLHWLQTITTWHSKLIPIQMASVTSWLQPSNSTSMELTQVTMSPPATAQAAEAANQTDLFNDKLNCTASHCCASNLLPCANITCGHLSIFNFLRVPHSNDNFHQRTYSAQSYKTETLNNNKAIPWTCHTTTTLFADGS